MTDTRVGGFVVLPNMPALRVTKTVDVLSDPVNGAVNPRQIPGSLQRYRVTVANTGVGFGRCEHARHCRLRCRANAELVVERRPCRAVLRRCGAERLDVQLCDARDVLEPARRCAAVQLRARRERQRCRSRTSRRCVSRRAVRCPARRAATSRASASSSACAFASRAARARAGNVARMNAPQYDQRRSRRACRRRYGCDGLDAEPERYRVAQARAPRRPRRVGAGDVGRALPAALDVSRARASGRRRDPRAGRACSPTSTAIGRSAPIS